MLAVQRYEDVTRIRLTTTFLRRPVYQVSAYLFDGTLIDTGPPRTGRTLAAWAAGQDIEQIINTHQHEDHVGGNAYLPQLLALAPTGALPVIQTAPRIPFYRWTTFGQPRPARAGPLHETVSTRHHTLQVIPTPGHAPDHVVLWLPERGWLFGGDLYLMGRARYLRRIDNVALWLESLRRVLDYDFDTLFCAHAGIVENAHDSIRRKIAFWEEIGIQARARAAQGQSVTQIRKELLGREGFLTWWSQGRFSKRNLVEALLAIEKEEAHQPASLL